jgi:mannose-6-phosphate isomerase
MNQPFTLIPEYRDYVWGGDQLRPGFSPTAEQWAVYEGNLIASGPFSGLSLGQAAAEQGEQFLGSSVFQQTGGRFPLLIKLLDCAQWLSLQVHPNDEQAARLEGAGLAGKTEAWHVLKAAPGAQLIAGMKPGVTGEALAAAIRDGTVLSLSQYRDVAAGDTVFMPAGTIHALGPGLLVYEVQQSSDLTYRVYDWGRPQTEKRKLHIEKSLAVANPQAAAPITPLPTLGDGSCQLLAQCPYFNLEILAAESNTLRLDTAGKSFHTITIIEGQAQIMTSRGEWDLKRFETIVIPAGCGAYQVKPFGQYRGLKASVE